MYIIHNLNECENELYFYCMSFCFDIAWMLCHFIHKDVDEQSTGPLVAVKVFLSLTFKTHDPFKCKGHHASAPFLSRAPLKATSKAWFSYKSPTSSSSLTNSRSDNSRNYSQSAPLPRHLTIRLSIHFQPISLSKENFYY